MPNKVNLELLAEMFVRQYITNKIKAGHWAQKHIHPEWNKELQPIIRKKLKKRGYKFNND